jgi:DNA invertase Pin-like site-specific DNA recombinase
MTNAPSGVEHPKITPAHLQRSAVVYVRQSSPKQVREHPESQRNQRALVARAQAFGWPEELIRVVDADLGHSAAQADGRDAFRAVVAEVALGHVGILFGWEVSRLARNNADWYQLLDVAALVGTLIADVEGIYDPRVYNDRLLLGLKGTMSEAELHLMRQRLTAGRLSQVARGEYVQHLPTGFVRLPDNRVAKDPDDQVRHVLSLVFTQFAELGSCQKVVRFLARNGILLPRRAPSGLKKGELLWKRPAASAIYAIVVNPAYAGAFVYGRRPTDPLRRLPGGRATGTVRQPMEAWQHLKQGVYPGYLSWEQYLANQAQMRDNAQRYAEGSGRGRGAPREGSALLPGLATCGECGHRMKVAYKPRGRYVCDDDRHEYGAPGCASLDGASIDAAVVEAFLAAIQPAPLDALEAVLAKQQQERAQIERHLEQQRQRGQYEAHLAQRRYQAVDPENRLVAAALEEEWEEALVTLRQSEAALEQFRQAPRAPALPPQLRRQLEQIAQALPELWASGRLTPEQQKRLLRSLVARVIVKRVAKDAVEVKIVWVSGHFSVSVVQPPILRECDVSGYERMVARVGELFGEGRSDREIAAQLTQEGFHSARRTTVSEATVQKIRLGQGWSHRLPRGGVDQEIDGSLTGGRTGEAARQGPPRKVKYR